ncbi:DUF501 domain-containing protein [Athalassotoga saccharophila]|uniref:DUF501 domain-containing protein n=1 Tax=Athalassotoga saccharophila TaxID=1441386 RepID=UPI00137B0A3D|nr:DUF501 domain-containing protein [Athalassotoga saccharophila]BBJ27181.1 hypothetical protein ATHSA_0049 [Athalassotoga saccharophila]
MIELEDLSVVSIQLNRIPKNVSEVVRRCSFGFPVVIRSFPILDGKPFPTLYWLTCPFMRSEISKIESNGGIKRYEEILSNSKELLDLQIEAHLKANEKIKSFVDENVKDLFKGGMGGIKDFRHVKCLHMHVAYHLGGIKNPVGESVLSEIKMECEDGICGKGG